MGKPTDRPSAVSRAVLAVAALAAGCAREPTRVVAPPLSADASASSEPQSYFLGAPTSNVTPTPQRNTLIFIPFGRVARVTVTGTLAFSANPDFQLCSGHGPEPLPDGADIGPSGFSTVPFPFRVFVGQSDLIHPAVAQLPFAFGASADESMSAYVGGAFGLGYLWAGRPAPWGSSCAGGPKMFPPTPEYRIFGGQAIEAVILPEPTISADRTTVSEGDTVAFTLNDPEGETIQLTIFTEWRWVTEAGGSGATSVVSGCGVERSCRMEVHERGHPIVVGLDYHTTNVSATGPTIEVGQNQDVTIKIDTVYGPLDGGSFTAREGESAITLKASVTPDSLAPRIKWTVMVDPGSFDGTPLPDNELTGAATSFAVAAPPDPVGRWPIVHPGGLPEKRLGYAVRASVEVNGRTYDSETRTLQQVERDVLREEYLELSVSVPREPNARFPEVADIGRDTTVHFNEHELNVRGDYTLYWAQAVFRDGIETVRSLAESDTRKGEAFPGLAVEASFRSPVHHEIHLVREGTVPKRYTSNHEFGLAIDFRLTGQPGLTAEQFFEKLRVYAKDRRVGACFEPRETITAGSKDTVPGHAHIDWGLPCEPDWS